MTRSASATVAGVPRAAHALLKSHARDRAGDTALIGIRGNEVVGVTWQDLALRVDRAAAGFLRADFRPHHAAIILMRPSIEAVEVELALRSVGAIAIHVAPDVTGDELAPLLAGVRVRLVISDDAEAVSRLEGYHLGNVEQLVLGGGTHWERVQGVGASFLRERPMCVRDAAAITDPVTSGAVHVLREEGQVAVRRLPTVAANGNAAATTLLNGPGWDPRVAAVRAIQLASGGALAWTDDPAQLPTLIQHATPDVLVTLAEGDQIANLLRDARVRGRPWHRSPAEAMAAAVTLTSGERIGPGVRRRAKSVESLRPWFGPRLRTVVLDREQDPALAAIAQVMELDVLAPPVPELEAVTLPRVPSRPPPPIRPLPHRRPSDPDEAFRLARSLETATDLDPGADEPGLPSLTLLLGDSMLDRLLANQANQRKAAQGAST